MEDRLYGCLYGQLIGDALGTRYEFQTSNNVMNKLKEDIKNNFLPILGGGPFSLQPGQVTDDSELALGLLHSIIEKGCYDKDDVAYRYRKWYLSGPFDIGNTTRRAFDQGSSYNYIVNSSKAENMDSLSNGCLMRASPMGMLGAFTTADKLKIICEQDCKMTNPNPICIEGTYVFCLAIREAILTGDRLKTYNVAKKAATNPTIIRVLNDAYTKPDPIYFEGKHVATDSQFMGLLLVALQNAFYELLHGHSFHNSLVNIIARGGDTDTNGCIAGSLLGALYGKSIIPNRWITSVNTINPRKMFYKEVDQQNIDDLVNQFKNILV